MQQLLTAQLIQLMTQTLANQHNNKNSAAAISN
jgi:hypothetical protein